MSYSMNALYASIGISKQAVYQQAARQATFDGQLHVLIREADDLRREHPGCGVEKMYYSLSPDFIGRDNFIRLFMELGYRLEHKKSYHRTTRSTSLYYPNLITGMLLSGPSQVWQSDITYIRVGERHYYAVFIIDVYTRKIVGYQVSDHMRAQANIAAFKMALRQNDAPLIHHSDRGSQYIYAPYLKLLKSNGCAISMGKIAQDNAYAERINGTIKNEYLDHWQPKNLAELKGKVSRAVKNYNTKRVHNNLNRNCPVDFEKQVLTLEMHKRPMATVYAEGQIKMERVSNPPPFMAQQALLAPNCPIVKKTFDNEYELKTVNLS
jgi:putative transposase